MFPKFGYQSPRNLTSLSLCSLWVSATPFLAPAFVSFVGESFLHIDKAAATTSNCALPRRRNILSAALTSAGRTDRRSMLTRFCGSLSIHSGSRSIELSQMDYSGPHLTPYGSAEVYGRLLFAFRPEKWGTHLLLLRMESMPRERFNVQAWQPMLEEALTSFKQVSSDGPAKEDRTLSRLMESVGSLNIVLSPVLREPDSYLHGVIEDVQCGRRQGRGGELQRIPLDVTCHVQETGKA
jgi:hypothetical protein